MGAEHAAAGSLMDQLPKLGGSAAAPKVLSENNPIGFLQDRAQKAGQALPMYAYQQRGDSFVCAVRLADVGDRSFKASGGTKAEAKRLAAADAMAFLQVGEHAP